MHQQEYNQQFKLSDYSLPTQHLLGHYWTLYLVWTPQDKTETNKVEQVKQKAWDIVKELEDKTQRKLGFLS